MDGTGFLMCVNRFFCSKICNVFPTVIHGCPQFWVGYAQCYAINTAVFPKLVHRSPTEKEPVLHRLSQSFGKESSGFVILACSDSFRGRDRRCNQGISHGLKPHRNDHECKFRHLANNRYRPEFFCSVHK